MQGVVIGGLVVGFATAVVLGLAVTGFVLAFALGWWVSVLVLVGTVLVCLVVPALLLRGRRGS